MFEILRFHGLKVLKVIHLNWLRTSEVHLYVVRQRTNGVRIGVIRDDST